MNNNGQVSDKGSAYGINDLAIPVYLPSLLFSIGEAGLLPIIPASAESLGADIPTAGVIAGLVMLGTLIADLPAGLVVDRFGERRAMIGASIVATLGILFSVFATNIYVLGLGILIIGMTVSVFALARHSFIAEHVAFSHRARALSLLGGMYRGGAFIGPLIGAGLVASFGVMSVYWLAVIFCGLAAIVLLATKPEKVTRKPRRASGAIWKVVKDERHKFFTVGLAASSLGIVRASRTIGLPLWALYINLPVETAALYIGIAGALDFALFYTSGQVVDRFGRLWAAVPTLAGMAVSLFALTLAQDATGFLIAALALSLSNALGSGLVMVIGADLAPKDARNEFLAFYRLMVDGGIAMTAPAISIMTLMFGLPVALAGVSVITLGGAFGMWKYIPKFEIN